MTTISDIKQALPNPSQRIEYLADSVDRMQEMIAMANTNGGKILLKELENQRQGCIARLISSLGNKPTLEELIAIIAELKTCYAMIERISTSKHIDTTMVQLEKAFREEAGV